MRARREVSFAVGAGPTLSVDDRLVADAAFARWSRRTCPCGWRPTPIGTPSTTRCGSWSPPRSGVRWTSSSDLTVAYTLRDPGGTVVSTGKREHRRRAGRDARRTGAEVLRPHGRRPGRLYADGSPWSTARGRGAACTIRSGRSSGRTGPLAVGDLTLAERPSSPGEFQTPVEARVSSGWLLAYTELYAHGLVDVRSGARRDRGGRRRVRAGASLRGRRPRRPHRDRSAVRLGLGGRRSPPARPVRRSRACHARLRRGGSAPSPVPDNRVTVVTVRDRSRPSGASRPRRARRVGREGSSDA